MLDLMREIEGRKTISDLLLEFPEPSEGAEKTSVTRKKEGNYWGYQPRGCNPAFLGEDLVELVVSPKAGISDLMKFTVTLEEKLRGADSYGNIVSVIPSRLYGTSYILVMKPVKFGMFLSELLIMPELEEVDYETQTGGAAHDKFWETAIAGTTELKKVRVLLKELGVTRPKLTRVLN